MGLESQGSDDWVSSTRGGFFCWSDQLLYSTPIAYIFFIQGFTDADGAAGDDLGGTYGNQFFERSWANESQGNGENFCMHSANLTSPLQMEKPFDFLEVNQDIQTTRLEYGTESLSPIPVRSKSPRPSIKVQICRHSLLSLIISQPHYPLLLCRKQLGSNPVTMRWKLIGPPVIALNHPLQSSSVNHQGLQSRYKYVDIVYSA